MDKRVIVNESKCKEIAEIIKNFKVKSENKTIREDEKTALYLFISVAICHQINWDFLHSTLEKIKNNSPEKFTPEYLSRISTEELHSWIKDYSKPWRLKTEKRAKLVRDCGKKLVEFFEGSVTNLIKQSNGFLDGENGLYNLLTKFEAYREDPLKKKSSVLIEFWHDSGLIQVKDWENFIPIIDYHVVRVNLRNGRIIVKDEELKNKLINGINVSLDDDIAIRSATIEAAKIINNVIGNEKILADFDWTIGRDWCDREKPNCKNGCQSKNHAFSRRFGLDCNKKCPFDGICEGSKNEEFRKLLDHKFETTFY